MRVCSHSFLVQQKKFDFDFKIPNTMGMIIDQLVKSLEPSGQEQNAFCKELALKISELIFEEIFNVPFSIRLLPP